MSLRAWWTTTLLACAFCVGGGDQLAAAASSYKCSMDTQTCLNEMVARLKKSGWLGVEYDDKDTSTLKLIRVVAGSPAEAVGLKVGDVLLALEGVKFSENSAQRCVTCDKVKDRWVPGQTFDYLVSRKGKEFHVKVTLAALPPDVMAQMIGMHMIEHAQPVTPQK